MTKIKICGITTVDDALACAALGADMIGLVFVASSPRCVDVAHAQDIIKATRSTALANDPCGTGTPACAPDQIMGRTTPRFVGVFRNAPAADVRRIAQKLALDFVQLHGDEDDACIAAAGVPAIKAYSVSSALPDTTAHPSAAFHLFDTRDDVRGGGTGRPFDWSLLSSHQRTRPLFLAGGLGPENVAGAIRLVRPDAIDVSSGVESAPGIKDHQKLRLFFERVQTT